jgi:hypothetical protein
VDRYGYEDGGNALIAALERTVGDKNTIARTDRYLALNIGALAHESNAGSTELVPATLSMGACEGPPLMIIDQIGAARAPFDKGSVHLPRSGELKVSGWAVDKAHQSTAGGVDVVMDRTPIASTYGLNRDDVAKYFNRPEYRDSGFVATMSAETLTKGEHALTVRVVSSDGKCYYEARSIPVIVD